MLQTSNLNKHFNSSPHYISFILNEFTKDIYLNSFNRNLNYLIEKSEFVFFDKTRWYQRPMSFCNEYYSEAYIYPVVLLVNNIGSVFDFIPKNFNKNNIIVPEKDSIIEITEPDFNG